MKSYITIIVFLLSFQSFGQSAGVQESYYTDIDPDSALGCLTSGGIPEGIFMLQRVEIDINGDLQADFKIESRANYSMAQNICEVNVIPLNTSSYVLIGRTDSVYNNYFHWWMTHPVAKPLLYGESINVSAAIWDSIQGTIFANSTVTGTTISINDFSTFSDMFVGIKYTNGIQTDYGWIRILIDNYLLVKDYSMSGNIVGFKESNTNDLLIYPNPAGKCIYIKSDKIFAGEFIFYDVRGQRFSLEALPVGNNTAKVDLSSLAEGIYTLCYQTSEGLIRKRFIVKE